MARKIWCKKHGMALAKKGGKNRLRCGKCLSEAVSKRRRRLKQLAVEYKGGKCNNCGYNKCNAALQFHHIDPFEKDFNLSVKGITRSWAKVKVELDKCVLLCANCHTEEHEKTNYDFNKFKKI